MAAAKHSALVKHIAKMLDPMLSPDEARWFAESHQRRTKEVVSLHKPAPSMPEAQLVEAIFKDNPTLREFYTPEFLTEVIQAPSLLLPEAKLYQSELRIGDFFWANPLASDWIREADRYSRITTAGCVIFWRCNVMALQHLDFLPTTRLPFITDTHNIGAQMKLRDVIYTFDFAVLFDRLYGEHFGTTPKNAILHSSWLNKKWISKGSEPPTYDDYEYEAIDSAGRDGKDRTLQAYIYDPLNDVLFPQRTMQAFSSVYAFLHHLQQEAQRPAFFSIFDKLF